METSTLFTLLRQHLPPSLASSPLPWGGDTALLSLLGVLELGQALRDPARPPCCSLLPSKPLQTRQCPVQRAHGAPAPRLPGLPPSSLCLGWAQPPSALAGPSWHGRGASLLPAPCPGHSTREGRGLWLCSAPAPCSSSQLLRAKRQLCLRGKPTGRELLVVNIRISIIICNYVCQRRGRTQPQFLLCFLARCTPQKPQGTLLLPTTNQCQTTEPTLVLWGELPDLPGAFRSPKALRDTSALPAPKVPGGYAPPLLLRAGLCKQPVNPHLGQVLA